MHRHHFFIAAVMNRRLVVNISALSVIFGIGILVGVILSSTLASATKDYSNELVLLELRQQSNVLGSLLRDDQPKASEFLITEIQSDLAYFETMVAQKTKALNKSKLCELLTTRVSATVESYARKEPSQSQYAEEHLRNLLAWCKSESRN